jgi:Subtilisin inhibitor-like
VVTGLETRWRAGQCEGMAPLPLIAAMAALIPAVTPPVAAPDSSFVLTVLRGESLQTANLTCDPPGGNHPAPGQACVALSLVDGEIEDLSDGAQACTMQYDPVTVRANGTWRGETRTFTADYSNPCVMRAETGPVFDF